MEILSISMRVQEVISMLMEPFFFLVTTLRTVVTTLTARDRRRQRNRSRNDTLGRNSRMGATLERTAFCTKRTVTSGSGRRRL